MMLAAQKGFASTNPLLIGLLCVLAGLGGLALWLLLQPQTPAQQLNAYAGQYVRLATSLAAHQPAEVDIYFGPAAADSRSHAMTWTLAQIRDEATQLQTNIAALPDGVELTRVKHLQDKVARLIALAETMQALEPITFSEELARLYGITLNSTEAPELQSQLDALQQLLPGRGTLAFRVAAFRNRLLIPADKRRAVFEAALAECRRRTAQFWPLPDSEELVIEWTRDVPAAWHDYEGAGRSVLRVNDLSIAFIDSAIDVACHEGYPGHHAQYTMLQQRSGSGPMPVEDTLTLLRSSESVLLEGAANYGVTLAFPPQERLQFERDVLAPIAGISLPDDEQYLAFSHLLNQFGEAVTPIVHEYYDGIIAFNTATFRLEREAMIASSSALLEFVNEFGTYVIGYTYAEKQIQNHIDTTTKSTQDAWTSLLDLVTTPTQSAVLLQQQ